MNEDSDHVLDKFDETLKNDLPPLLLYLGPEITPDMKLADGTGYEEFKERLIGMADAQIDKIRALVGSSQKADKYTEHIKKGLKSDEWAKTVFYSLYINDQENMKKKEC